MKKYLEKMLADAEYLTKSGVTVVVKGVPAVRDPKTGAIYIHQCDVCTRLAPGQRDGCAGCRKKPRRYSRYLRK